MADLFADTRPLMEQEFQTESYRNRTIGKRRSFISQRKCDFVKTVCTICFATAIGAFGIYVSLGYYEYLCRPNGDCNKNGTADHLPGKATKPAVEPAEAKNVAVTDPDEVMVDTLPARVDPKCTAITRDSRRDCWPQSKDVTQQKCEQKGCCWLQSFSDGLRYEGIPYCFYPSDYQGYTVQSLQRSDTGVKVKLQLSQPSGWPNDTRQLNLDVNFQTADRLNFKFYDPNNARFEVPITLSRNNGPVTAADTAYDVDIPSQGAFYITVTRKSTGQVLFSSLDASPLVFADQFLQLGTQLSTQYIYGLGEHQSAFLVSTNWTKLAFWSRDQPPSGGGNLYGVHPFYLNIEKDHNAHGVFLLNSNAMEVEVQPPPALTYRTTGGILDFYVFTGPSPDNVVQQYTEIIGRPFMPPYWALGFHLCRWGYSKTSDMKKIVDRMRAAKMPYDTQWNDIDYMRNHLDWTYDKQAFGGLPELVADLHEHGQHYIMIIDPGISNSQPATSYPAYDIGMKMDIFIKTSNGSAPIIGKVWPGTTVFPDFYHPDSTKYWTLLASTYHATVPFDGIWIDMNEPSNFVDGSTSGCPDNTLENPPFHPPVMNGGTPRAKTLCASARQHISTHYNLHSLYGHSEAVATKSAMDSILGNKRSIVISRSSYPGTGTHAGHWLGDNRSQWADTYYSIPGILNFNLFGIPLVGADICGFSGSTTPELCTRWMQLGAFYPFMRNHNVIGTMDQDPAFFDTATQKIMRDALNLRYTLLPYLYTLFYRSHVDGLPVVRPLFFQYPVSDYNVTYMVDVQFMWGSALLITPVTSQSTTKGLGYLPKDRWYDWFNHTHIDSPGHYITFDLPMEHINLQVRGGSIIPLQSPNVTTTLARKNKFMLFSALDTGGAASGELYWDDGESTDAISSGTYNLVSFQVSRRMLTSSIVTSGYTSEPMMLGELYVLGVDIGPTSVTANGNVVPPTDYSYINKTLIVHNLSENLLQPLNISWLI